jgi:glycine oxidase
MINSVGIVGAGLVGRMLAVALATKGVEVTLFDRDNRDGSLSCAWAWAGMLAPYSELDCSEEIVFRLGVKSLDVWPSFLAGLRGKVFFQTQGSLILAHAQDRADLLRFKKHLENKLPSDLSNSAIQSIDTSEVLRLEPDLPDRFAGGLYLIQEGQVDNRQLLRALEATLDTLVTDWYAAAEVHQIEPQRVTFSYGKTLRQTQKFEWVIDARGLGARPDISSLRGVRGELITVHAPDVRLNRPVRLMHPRYPLYVVPRENDRFLIGATSIESEDRSPITVQSALELLSAAFSLHPGFAQAAIEEMRVNCRPALADNCPRIFYQPGLLRVNGLHRHGFLVSPKLVDLVVKFLSTGEIEQAFASVFSEEKIASANTR